MASSQRKSRVKLNKKHWDAPWKMVKRFGNRGDGNLERENTSAVTINKDGNVAVAIYSQQRINVYGVDDGELKLSTDRGYSDGDSGLVDVAVAHDGNYITSNAERYFYIRSKGNDRYEDRSIRSNTGTRTLGISINSQNHILVGDNDNKLSVYNYPDMSLISCVKTPIEPSQISATSHDDRIIISGGRYDTSVHVIDAKGNIIRTLCPPKDVTASWHPGDVCTIGKGEEEEVFICNNVVGGSHGVYRFSLSTGKCLGCVTTELRSAGGIVFTDDGKLVVLDEFCLKIFMPNTK